MGTNEAIWPTLHSIQVEVIILTWGAKTALLSLRGSPFEELLTPTLSSPLSPQSYMDTPPPTSLQKKTLLPSCPSSTNYLLVGPPTLTLWVSVILVWAYWMYWEMLPAHPTYRRSHQSKNAEWGRGKIMREVLQQPHLPSPPPPPIPRK